METTLTIRLSTAHRLALKRRTRAEKRSESALVRDMIEREMEQGFELDKVRHLVGSVTLDDAKMRMGDTYPPK